jgi:hypothetical protein
MLPSGDSLDAALHVKEALEEGALSITVLREWVKPNARGEQPAPKAKKGTT